MVIDAVKGTPTTAPSRTAHIRSSDRAQTPRGHGGSSSSETDSDAPTEVGTEGSGDVDGSSKCGDSDSAT